MQQPKLIGLAGRKGSGKDTAARFIASAIDGLDYTEAEYFEWFKLNPYEVTSYVFAFADPVYQMLAIALNKSVWWLHQNKDTTINGITIRQMLQTLGTEWGWKNLGRDGWVNRLDARVKSAADTFDLIIIPDVRVNETEAAYIRANHGVIWHILKPADPTQPKDHHVTEHGVPILAGDVVIDNNGTLDDFKGKVLHHLELMRCLKN